jgi:hypothetical protein
MIVQKELSDHITYRCSNIQYTLRANDLHQGLVKYLSKFGSLYFGNLCHQFFKNQYFKVRSDHINQLINIQETTNSDLLQSIRFNLHMLRRAQNESWQLPGTLTETDQGLHWGSGNSRLFASGMCHNNAYQQVKFLILQKHQTTPNLYIENPILISTDDELHTALNISTNTAELPLVELQIYTIPEISHARVALSSINNWDLDDHQTVGKEYLQDFVEWQKLNGKRPTLKIYTDWPEQISNDFNAWNIEFAGPTVLYKEKIRTYGTLELFLYNRNNNNNTTNEHELFVLSPNVVDVADLLFWVNNKYTAFVEKNLDFVLFKKQPTYLTTQINVSALHN